MTSTEDKVRVASRISKELDVRLRKYYVTSSSAIPDALELVAATKEGIKTPNDATTNEADVSKYLAQVDALTQRVVDIMASNEFLKEEVTVKNGQLEKSAYHIQSLIQEVNKLNVKLLEDKTGTKKPWYKFW